MWASTFDPCGYSWNYQLFSSLECPVNPFEKRLRVALVTRQGKYGSRVYQGSGNSLRLTGESGPTEPRKGSILCAESLLPVPNFRIIPLPPRRC